MNYLTNTAELAKQAGLSLDATKTLCNGIYWSATQPELEAFRALCISAHMDKLIAECGVEPVGYLATPTQLAHKSASVDITLHRPTNRPDWTVDQLYTAEQFAAARLQDQQKIAELEAKELDLYKQLAEAKLSALNGWQRYEQANSHRKELLEAQLDGMKGGAA